MGCRQKSQFLRHREEGIARSEVHVGSRGCRVASAEPAGAGEGRGAPYPGRVHIDPATSRTRAKTRPVTLRLAATDIDTARARAAQRKLATRPTSRCSCTKPCAGKPGSNKPRAREVATRRVGSPTYEATYAPPAWAIRGGPSICFRPDYPLECRLEFRINSPWPCVALRVLVGLPARQDPLYEIGGCSNPFIYSPKAHS